MTIIPQGYKETEIGVLPNDWDIKSYGELFYFLNTATYSRAELSDDSDIDYVHYGDIHTKCNYHVDFTKMILPCITSDKLKKYPLLEIGDLIMADASEDYEGIGKSVEILNIGKKSISGLHTFLLRNKSNSLALGFKGYIHANQYVRNQFNSLATGMKVYGVSKGNLRSILIPIPSLPEQTAIANALRDIDDLITTTQALIAKKKAIKTATMQQLLTPKEDWVEMRFDNICLQDGIVRGPFGGALKKGIFKKSGYKVYEQRNAIYSTIEIGSYFIDENKLKELQRFELKTGDFIVSCSGTIGKIYKIPSNYYPGIINQALLKLSINSNVIIPDFFEHIFKWDKFQSKIIDGTQGGAMKNLVGMPTFKKTIVCIPNLDTQRNISLTLNEISDDIKQTESTLFKYQSIKQGMMQNLLTGKIRLI